MFQKYCLFVYYFIRLPASEFMVVRSCYNFSFSSRIRRHKCWLQNGRVYAYHWKHKRCTIKMRHEYISSRFCARAFKRVVSNYFSSLSVYARNIIGWQNEHKTFCINHIFLIIFTLVWGETFPKWQGFSWIYSTSTKVGENLIAFDKSCCVRREERKVANKNQHRTFLEIYKNLFVEYIQSKISMS